MVGSILQILAPKNYKTHNKNSYIRNEFVNYQVIMKKGNQIQNLKKQEVKITTAVYSFLILIAGIIFVFGVLIYALDWSNNFIRKIENIIPYPAVMIGNSKFISFGELNSNVESVKKFYESQDFSEADIRIDFSTESGKNRLKIKGKEILNRMIEDKAVEILAGQKGIKISSATVDQNLDRKLEEYGSGDNLKDNLKRLYDWTIEDFKNKIVKPDLYRQELEKVFSSSDNSVSEARNQMEKAKEELDKKKNFAEAAKTYSKGSTASDGGELGWFKRDQLIPDISDSVFSLEKGKRSGIMESSLGFHIVEVKDKKTENDSEMVDIRQIFIPKKLFYESLDAEMKKMKFRIFAKEYSWNSEKSMVEFRNAEMKKVEEDIIKNSQGDASVLF